MNSLFEYEKYREYLKDYIASKPKRGWGLMKKWAEDLSLNPTFLSQVLSEKKHLSVEQALALCQLLKLPTFESKFLILLLQRERAGTHALKSFFEIEINEIRKLRLKASTHMKTDHVLTDEDKSKYYSSWIYAAIRIFSAIGAGKSYKQIEEKFLDYSVEQIEEAVEFLLKVKLCAVTKENKITVGPAIIFIDRNSPFFTKHHNNWRLRAMNKVDRLSEGELMLTMPMSVSYKSFEKISGQLMDIFKNALEEVKKSEPQDLACLNIDLFWPSSNN